MEWDKNQDKKTVVHNFIVVRLIEIRKEKEKLFDIIEAYENKLEKLEFEEEIFNEKLSKQK